MKKTLCFSIITLLLFLCSCAGNIDQTTDTRENSIISTATPSKATESTTSQNAVESMTMIRTNSPPLCKTTNNQEMVHNVWELLNSAEKELYTGTFTPAGWVIKIDFSDGTYYALSGDMLSTAAVDYHMENQNAKALYTQLMEIYHSIDSEEIRYTKNPYQ